MKFFNLHTHQFTNNQAVFELVNQYPNDFDATINWYSIGIHPWYIDEENLENELEFINQKLQEKKCLALGECGLDKRITVDFSLQKRVFEAQIALAEKHQKPIIVHCVAAYDELIAIKKQKQVTVPMFIHGFSKNWQTAKQLLENGFYLSFGKYLLRNPELETVFTAVPNDRFLLETDTIDETIQEVYTKAAQYKNLDISKLQHFIAENCKNIFNIEL